LLCAAQQSHTLHRPVPDEEDEGPDDSHQNTPLAEDASGYSHSTEHACVAAAKVARDTLIHNCF